jgi:hypothetical protein
MLRALVPQCFPNSLPRSVIAAMTMIVTPQATMPLASGYIVPL